MSELKTLTWQHWLSRLSRESLLVDHLPYDETGEHATHLEAFVKAMGTSEALDARSIQRLLLVTQHILQFRIVFQYSPMKLFYGSEVLGQTITSLYGPSIGAFLAAEAPQRRLLVESEDAYSAEQFSRLVAGVLSGEDAKHVLHMSWAHAHEQKFFDASSRAASERAYDMYRQRKYWILDSPHGLAPNAVTQILEGFPAILTGALGDAQLLMTIANPLDGASIRPDFRKVLGTHGIIRIESLNTKLRLGLPISEVVQAELTEIMGTEPNETMIRQLSARLIDYHFPENRRSLVALLAMTQARGLLSYFDEEGFEQMMNQLEPMQTPQVQADDEARLARHIADGLMAGHTLPELSYDFERQAYLYAARVCSMKRPHQNVRVQDLAHLLKTPRQTVSRKWHAFQIRPEEYRADQ